MYTVKRFNVYREGNQGATNMTPFRSKAGVYSIFENGKLVYIGNSRFDLYKTVLRHFQKWVDMEQPNRVSYHGKKHHYELEITVLNERSKVEPLEAMLIAQFKPRDNKEVQYTKYNNKYKELQEVVKPIAKAYNDAEEYPLEEAPF